MSNLQKVWQQLWEERNSDRLLAQARHSPVEAAKACQTKLKDLDVGYRRELYLTLAMSFEIARQFGRREQRVKDFLREPFWQSVPRPPSADDVQRDPLRWTIIFIFGARGRMRRDRANKYTKALTQYYDDKINSAELEERLRKDGGVEALLVLARHKEARVGSSAAKAGGRDAATTDTEWGDEDQDRVKNATAVAVGLRPFTATFLKKSLRDKLGRLKKNQAALLTVRPLKGSRGPDPRFEITKVRIIKAKAAVAA